MRSKIIVFFFIYSFSSQCFSEKSKAQAIPDEVAANIEYELPDGFPVGSFGEVDDEPGKHKAIIKRGKNGLIHQVKFFDNKDLKGKPVLILNNKGVFDKDSKMLCKVYHPAVKKEAEGHQSMLVKYYSKDENIQYHNNCLKFNSRVSKNKTSYLPGESKYRPKNEKELRQCRDLTCYLKPIVSRIGPGGTRELYIEYDKTQEVWGKETASSVNKISEDNIYFDLGSASDKQAVPKDLKIISGIKQIKELLKASPSFKSTFEMAKKCIKEKSFECLYKISTKRTYSVAQVKKFMKTGEHSINFPYREDEWDGWRPGFNFEPTEDIRYIEVGESRVQLGISLGLTVSFHKNRAKGKGPATYKWQLELHAR